ncbi:hypothetical protein VPH35_129104 [Triticum aestivum]
MEGMLNDLKLSEAEKKSVKIGRRQICSSTVSKLQTIGNIFSERPAKEEFVGRTLGNLWCPFAELDCKDLGRNRFLFTFPDETSKKKALDGGPWRFNKDLIVMEKFVASKTIDEYEFKWIPIWVRAYGIPTGMMSSETGDLVGERIGEVLDIDVDWDGTAMGQFMRIKVRMDITMPITRFITLEIEYDEEEQEAMCEELMSNAENREKKKWRRLLISNMSICLIFAIVAASLGTQKNHAYLEPEERELDSMGRICGQLSIKEALVKRGVEAQVIRKISG